ncbi:SDR family NAD(P)-dependent oxidoreductase [Yinghuangia sp. YIM S09857]|uniref:SDR family NAD(P)-dependent oxidoreductase n=1 Tax=Yinghuangia sp. YIM S09857 TaxID=3436929 RepID=UPI003F53D7BA
MDPTSGVVIVTGGAGGLGEATVRRLHRAGAAVVVFDRDEARAAGLATDLGSRARSCAGDAADDADMEKAVATAEELGALRGLVACAGGAARSLRTVGKDGIPHPMELFREVLEGNAVSAFNSLRLAAAAMSKQEPDSTGERGAVVLTASIAAYEGQIGQIAYAAAKAAVVGMTLVGARDLAAAGVRVNTIAPGTFGTPGWDAAPPGVRERLEAKVPFPRRFGAPEEFAAAAEHLLTNGYVNGHVLRLDGAVRFDPA